MTEAQVIIDRLLQVAKNGDLTASFSGCNNFLIECQLNVLDSTWVKSQEPSKVNSRGDISIFSDKDGMKWQVTLKGEAITYKKEKLTVIFEI